MSRIETESIADLFMQIQWSSDIVHHTEAYAASDVNFWRDLLPGRLKEDLVGRTSGDRIRIKLPAGDLITPAGSSALQTIQSSQFNGTRIFPVPIRPRVGRFYPKGVLTGISNVYKENREPFRLVEARNDHLTIDLGHPLTGKSIELSVTVGSVWPKISERGGALRNWGETITNGAGMQARWKTAPSDFFSDAPFERQDDQPDDLFYAEPRLVEHIDSTASSMVQQIYSRFVSDGTRLLDLMSSWQSHLPTDIRLSSAIGVGLNRRELEENLQLNEYRLLDLNGETDLPFAPDHFDVAICSLSVEYLTSPIEVFRQVARILRPGGWFVVTFSNRWFETKAIRIWSELHEFERMGLVLEYFRRSECFTDLETYSILGLPRPEGDRYYGEIAHADPVYAVWGRTHP